MIVELKAKVQLTIDEVREALSNYIKDQGLNVSSELEIVTELPEVIVVEADAEATLNQTAQAAPVKPKAEKPKAQPKPQTKAVDADEDSGPAPTDEQIEAITATTPPERTEKKEVVPPTIDFHSDTPAYKKAPSDEEKAKASAEAQDLIKKTQEILEQPKPKARPTNIFADDPADSDVVDDDEKLAGQDILDAKPAGEKVANPFAAVAKTATRRVDANRLFG